MTKVDVTFEFNLPSLRLVLDSKIYDALMNEALAGRPIKVNGKWWVVSGQNNEIHAIGYEEPVGLNFDLYLAEDQRPPRMRGFDEEINTKTQT